MAKSKPTPAPGITIHDYLDVAMNKRIAANNDNPEKLQGKIIKEGPPPANNLANLQDEPENEKLTKIKSFCGYTININLNFRSGINGLPQGDISGGSNTNRQGGDNPGTDPPPTGNPGGGSGTTGQEGENDGIVKAILNINLNI